MVYLAIYTNAVKSYCDRRFFSNLNSIMKVSEITQGMVVDNSYKPEYARKLKELTTLSVVHIEVVKDTFQFQRNVIASLNILRVDFLKTKCEYFFIIETDIIPPKGIVEWFKMYWKDERCKNAGILGAYYYRGFHKFENDLEQTHHVLSGCTMYKREVIEKYPFRIDLNANAGAFPDAWICYDINKGRDAGENDYLLYNIPVNCIHLGKMGTNSRGQEELYL